ncbi:hypothetical protein [Parachryseolinea silvisoli]|uniref:hypothetical protein n=1 Tax=Parachryseolinea silvisoli TaxID=2873601 RepID=UPI00226596AC|nr:hypothetical protein [Parachryseolinea silvisoli]MCD9014259.1 hypothetical protein [Parachryseolinea silvisoli]
MIKRYILLAIGCVATATAVAQSSYAPLNEDYYHTIDRYEVKTGRILPQLFTSVKPYKRSAIVALVDTVNALEGFQSRADRFNYDYLRNDSWEWSHAETADSKKPFLKHFYRKKSDLFHVDEPGFDLHVNPVLYLGTGHDTQRDDALFINTRGVEVRGMIDRKIGFYTYLTDNQAVLPSYVWRQMSLNPVIPHEGFWKEFKSGKGVDFLQARGHISVDASRSINLQMGYDRFFIGNGVRSFIFSDYAPPVSFFKANIKVWKLNYQYFISEMTADVSANLGGSRQIDQGYPDKFVTFHHLSINIGKKLNVGVFESVIFSPDDTLGSGKFEWAYLNPIIFYRAIEQQNGSSDNVILGMDFKWNAVRKLSFYGQFVLDEFVLDHIKSGDGWWANKFAVQVGGKYIDAFGVPNLDLQGEINIARPFIYSHNTNYANYSHYQQPLAHPLGSNFEELVGVIRYQPLPRLNLTGKLMVTRIGRDSTDVNWGSDEQQNYKYNWGSDILKRNTTREKEYGNTVGQGIKNDLVYASFIASWQFRHNLFIDLNVVLRQSKANLAFYNNNTSITSVALRWNIARRSYEL